MPSPQTRYDKKILEETKMLLSTVVNGLVRSANEACIFWHTDLEGLYKTWAGATTDNKNHRLAQIFTNLAARYLYRYRSFELLDCHGFLTAGGLIYTDLAGATIRDASLNHEWTQMDTNAGAEIKSAARMLGRS